MPFMRLGEVVLREKHLPLSPVSLKDIIFNHPGACSLYLSDTVSLTSRQGKISVSV